LFCERFAAESCHDAGENLRTLLEKTRAVVGGVVVMVMMVVVVVVVMMMMMMTMMTTTTTTTKTHLILPTTF
jgi:hypothetical protein